MLRVIARSSRVARSARLATPQPQRLVRNKGSEPAVAEVIVKEAADGTVTASAPKPAAPAPAPAAVSAPKKPAASAWQKLTAFVTGVGVSSAVYFYTLQQDVWESTATIERSIGAMKSDIVAVNRELRERVAVLEHEVAQLKRS